MVLRERISNKRELRQRFYTNLGVGKSGRSRVLWKHENRWFESNHLDHADATGVASSVVMRSIRFDYELRLQIKRPDTLSGRVLNKCGRA